MNLSEIDQIYQWIYQKFINENFQYIWIGMFS